MKKHELFIEMVYFLKKYIISFLYNYDIHMNSLLLNVIHSLGFLINCNYRNL